MIKGGCTFWARQTFDSDIFYNKPDKWFKIWFFIVSRVNYKDNSTFKRGENLITYYEIIERTKATKDQIYKAIRYFKTERMIDANKTTRGFIIKVLNYGIYQDIENYQDDSKTTARRQQDDTITKEGKEIIKNIYISKKFLLNIPSKDLDLISKDLGVEKEKIILKGKVLYDWCESKGKVYKNYKAFLKNCLRSDLEKTKQPINNLLKGTKNYEDFKRGL